MYGGGKFPMGLEKGNREFIQMITEACEKKGVPISEAAIHQAKVGWDLYYKGDKLTAIKRFNQAWLLDNECLLAFVGFAVISRDRGNLKESIVYYKNAIELGLDDPRIYNDYGLVLLQKAEINNNFKEQHSEYNEALKLFERAATSGYVNAQYRLGQLYRKGQGVDKDLNKAIDLFEKAALQGFIQAQTQLGLMYWYGKEIPKDGKKALKWTQMAVDKGDANAQGILAYLYATGVGVEHDFVKAYMWAHIAMARGDKKIQGIINQLHKDMTPEQIAEGKKLAEKWLEKNKTE